MGGVLKTRFSRHPRFCIVHDPMDDFEDCGLVFGSDIDKPYQKEAIDEIIHHRQELEDQLFIDRLLRALGIDDGEVFKESRYFAYAFMC